MTDARDTRVDVRLRSAIEGGTLPKQLLIEGPAGTGKTFAILCLLHILASDFPDLRILICRQTRVSLTESVLVTFEQSVLPLDGMTALAQGVKRSTRQSYRYPGGSEIVLGGLDKPDRIASTAWDVIYPNEAIELTEEGWDTLWSRLNRPGRDKRFGYLIGDTNPGDPSHWLNKRCDDGKIARWRTGHRANPVLHDGKGWTEAGETYITETLGRLQGTRRKRLLDGIWAAGEGRWFEAFDATAHVTEAAEFSPRWPVHLAVDTGVHTGAVWFQVRGEGDDATLSVFGDYYDFGSAALANGKAILEKSAKLVPDSRNPWERQSPWAGFDVGSMDPAGNASTGTGTTIGAEYLRAGLKLNPWPKYPGCVASGLALIESFLPSGVARMIVHPRCEHLISAMANYKRKKRGGQWIDEPEDPQHPHEELIDALRSGLLNAFPAGRTMPHKLRLVPAGRVF